jgi:hypothetical protein
MSSLSHGQDFTKGNTCPYLASQIPGECNDKRFYRVSVFSITVGFIDNNGDTYPTGVVIEMYIE